MKNLIKTLLRETTEKSDKYEYQIIYELLYYMLVKQIHVTFQKE